MAVCVSLITIPRSVATFKSEWQWGNSNNPGINIQPHTTATTYCSKPLQLAFNKQHASTRLYSFWSKPFSCIPSQRQNHRKRHPFLVYGTGSQEQKMGGTEEEEDEKWEPRKYQALLRGGEQVTSVLQEMTELLDEMKMDAQSEQVAVEIVAQGVVGKIVEKLDASFMMALDFMIGQSQNDIDQRKFLEVIKDTVLSYLTKKMPSHVQVVGMLCRTPRKESRVELLRRVAGGGGTFNTEDGNKVVLPKANLNDIANQANDLLETMEKKPSVPDRMLLARLVLIREEARSMMGGGILDERNIRGLNILPDAEVEFVSKLVGMKPGPPVREKIKNVMQGRNEGADKIAVSNEKTLGHSSKQETQKRWPVRPGTFTETITKVLGGMYETNVAGVTVQHLEWVYKETLNILQEMAFDSS